MAAHLPPDSATHRAIRPPEPDDAWDLDAQLLALIGDRLGELVAVQSAVAGGKRRVNVPDPIPRPGVERKGIERIAGDSVSMDEFDAWYTERFA